MKKQDPNSGDIDGDKFFSNDNSIIETQKVIVNITLNYSASLEIKIVKIVEAIFHQHHSRFSWLKYEKRVGFTKALCYAQHSCTISSKCSFLLFLFSAHFAAWGGWKV